MLKDTNAPNPSNFTYRKGNILYIKGNILYNHQGIDTIRLIGKYETISKLCQRLGLDLTTAQNNTPLSNTLKKLNQLSDTSTRYKQEDFKPTLEVVKLAKGKALSNHMTITRNTPVLHEYATHQKRLRVLTALWSFRGYTNPRGNFKKKLCR